MDSTMRNNCGSAHSRGFFVIRPTIPGMSAQFRPEEEDRNRSQADARIPARLKVHDLQTRRGYQTSACHEGISFLCELVLDRLELRLKAINFVTFEHDVADVPKNRGRRA